MELHNTMELHIPANSNRQTVFDLTRAYLDSLGLEIKTTDSQRPWGGFFVIDPESADQFIGSFFPELNKTTIYKYGSELSPKILLIEPQQKLSWQYHNRRAELWKVVLGPVGVMVSNNDIQPKTPDLLETGEAIEHGNQLRHRLIGLDDWGVIAELWQHCVDGYPSDEKDIVRLEDSYGRS